MFVFGFESELNLLTLLSQERVRTQDALIKFEYFYLKKVTYID